MDLVTGGPPNGGPDGEEDERRRAGVEEQQRGRHAFGGSVGERYATVVEREHAVKGFEEGDELRRSVVSGGRLIWSADLWSAASRREKGFLTRM